MRSGVCVLHADRLCTLCGECEDRCELDPTKICDNCFRCLDSMKPFETIPIGGVFLESDYAHGADRASQSVSLVDGYVWDMDDAWLERPVYRISTMQAAYGARKRRS